MTVARYSVKASGAQFWTEADPNGRWVDYADYEKQTKSKLAAFESIKQLESALWVLTAYCSEAMVNDVIEAHPQYETTLRTAFARSRDSFDHVK